MDAQQEKKDFASLMYDKIKLQKKTISNVSDIENEIYSINDSFDEQRIFNKLQKVLPNQIKIYKCVDIINYAAEARNEIDLESKNILNKIKKHKFFDDFLIKLRLIINVVLTIGLVLGILISFFPTFSILASKNYSQSELASSLQLFAILFGVLIVVNLILFLINNIVCKLVWKKVVNNAKKHFDEFERKSTVKYMSIFTLFKDQIIFPYIDDKYSNPQNSEEFI